MKHRLAIFTVAFAFIFTLISGVRTSRADEPFYYLWNNIRLAQCTNSTWSFFSNDLYNTPASGDVAQITQQLQWADSGVTTIATSGFFVPYWAAHPGTGGFYGTGRFWASSYYLPAYNVPTGRAYFVTLQLIYRGVAGGRASSSFLRFKCSGDNSRNMTLIQIDNQKLFSNL
jgi:hypothetical protein